MEHFNPEVLFVGDLHLHERPEFPGPIGENPRLLDGLNILYQIAALVKRSELKYVIFTGDLFELKDKIPNHILVQFTQRIENIKGNGAEVIALRGNHDFKIPEYSTTSIFPSIVFINDVITWGLFSKKGDMSRTIGCIPYYRDQKEFQEKWIEYHNRPQKPDIIMFHNELPGVYYSTKMKAPADWDVPLFDNTIYIGGHIHQPQILNVKNKSIMFIGTPYQIDFDDVSAKRNYGVLLYDLDLNRLEGHYFDYPRFVEIKLDNLSAITPTKGNYVRIVGTAQPQERSKIRELRESLLSRGAKGVQLKVKYITEHISRIKAEKSDYRGVISQYLRGSDTKLDREKLLQTGLNLMEKVK